MINQDFQGFPPQLDLTEAPGTFIRLPRTKNISAPHHRVILSERLRYGATPKAKEAELEIGEKTRTGFGSTLNHPEMRSDIDLIDKIINPDLFSPSLDEGMFIDLLPYAKKS